ncbi:tetratricopeptide (TPR) repeat protein [Filimonas zeae]|uniref:Membrane protein n=1 Tax=Filimonas zeae TaxID=1737353 RepID=A0A917ISN3_9BACT|nr:RagB/SusD family nutrient uptake outer membrane protein [Filimonas zeae]MDR6338063.1 tetratricopeptide (TPR) repeat protein [Filimonas zeae]GGH61532.1 membrane protein [Filimonas zeae]
MKKHIHSSFILLIAITAVVSSCKDSFLEVIPKGKQVASSVNDYELLMNSAIHYQYSGGGWQVPVLLGDEIAAEDIEFQQAYPQTQRLFKWEAQVYELTDESQDIKVPLTNNYALNKIINEVMDAEGGTEVQKRILKAEAMATRAFNYFQLINLYAKPYNEATAATDPGFPVNTTSDITKNNFSRGTVKEMYDFIIADLKEAIAALPATQPVSQTRMSRAAASALLGKVYLFMAKPEEALMYLNQAFADMNAWPVPARLYDYNNTFAPGGSFLPIGWNGPISPSVNRNDFTETLLSKTFMNISGNGNNGIIISPATAALYGSSDLRLKFYSATFSSNMANPSGRLRKYGVLYSRFGIGLADMYLLRAECKARTNDVSGAVEDVQALRSKRMPAADAVVPAAVAGDRAALIAFIIDERIREFAAEGHRWFDMRRLSVDPLFTGISFTHTLFLTGGGTETYTLQQPNRLVLRLPYTILSVNPGMADNP